jgi:hypothetical protein
MAETCLVSKKQNAACLIAEGGVYWTCYQEIIHLGGTPLINILPVRREVMREHDPLTWSNSCAFCQYVLIDSGIPSASMRSPPFIVQ